MMKAAYDLLQSLRDFGWPILAYIIVASVAVFVVPSGSSREDRIAKLLLVGAVITIIELFFLIGTAGADFVEVARLHPVWGSYAALLMLAVLVAVGKWAIRRARENQASISLTSDENEVGVPKEKSIRIYIALMGGGLAGLTVAVIWLSKIANSQ